ANAAFDGSAVELSGAGLLHVGYPSLLPALTASGGAALEALLARARATGVTTSLDLAVLDPASPAAAVDWRALLGRVLPLVDILTPSLDDVRTALGLDADARRAGLQELARRLFGMGAGIVMLTAGPAGLALCTADPARLAGAGALFADTGRQDEWSGHEHFAPTLPVEVRTTLGAGDAATAGWAVRGVGPAAMQLGNRANDRQPEAGAVVGAGRVRARALPRARQKPRRKAGSVVEYVQLDARPDEPGGELHLAGGVTQRVVEHVVECLGEPVAVDRDERQPGGRAKADPDVARGSAPCRAGGGGIEQL